VQNRKDLLQAHRLMTQRAALALLCGEPDSPNQPLRRLNVGTACGILAAAIAAAVFAVLGLIAPSSSASGLTQPGTLTVDKDTATAYVPCENGKLCPALNYASALLALGTQSPRQVTVTQAALDAYPIGPTIGIVGLPQDLPLASSLVKGPWSVCTSGLQSTLVGGITTGGTAVGTARAVLVTNPQGSDWVLWHGERMLIAAHVMVAVFGNAQPTEVPDSWLDALPQGPGFAAPPITGQGTTTTDPMGGGLATVGQVFTEEQHDFVLVTGGGLAPISATQAQLLEAEPGAPAPQAIAPSTVTSHLARTTIPSGGLPAAIPAIASTPAPLCITYGSGHARQLSTGATIPAGATATGATDGTDVDQVWLPPGHGALAGATAGTAASQPATYFLIDGATRYALSAPAVAQILGYALPADTTVLPAAVLDLLPEGPALDPAAATHQAGS
jgi:type VII secretion protein EccB